MSRTVENLECSVGRRVLNCSLPFGHDSSRSRHYSVTRVDEGDRWHDHLHCIRSADYVLEPPPPISSEVLGSRRVAASMNFWASAKRCLPSSAIISNRRLAHSW